LSESVEQKELAKIKSMIAEATIGWHNYGAKHQPSSWVSQMYNTKTYFKSTGKNMFCDEYLYQEAMRAV